VIDLSQYIRELPDFPAPGINYKDITPLLGDSAALASAVDRLTAFAEPLAIDYVVSAEARGFILGPALAARIGAGFVPARKPGKLPSSTISAEYVLEYGVDSLELHADALENGARVLVHDDLLATGGTAAVLCELVAALGGEVVACAFLIELSFLGGRERFKGTPVHALVDYGDS